MGNPMGEWETNAMGEWKRRQSANLADKPMQGPKTEMQMLRDEIAALRDKINSDGMARALSEHGRTRCGF